MAAEYTFKVRTYECGPDGFATMPSICNYLQEAASVHAGELGFSKSNFASAGEDISWVLTRLKVRMESYPKWEDEITVRTFPRGGRRIVAWRDFEIRGADGKTLGAASSEWMLINLASRKIVPVPETVLALADPAEKPVLGMSPFVKFRPPVPEGEKLTFIAQKSHIDLNGHVNNVHYLEWMLEPSDSSRPGEIDVVFRGEALAGDKVDVFCAKDEDGASLHGVFSPDGGVHAVARSLSRA